MEKEFIENQLLNQKKHKDNSPREKLLGWKPTQNIEDWVPGYKKELGLDV